MEKVRISLHTPLAGFANDLCDVLKLFFEVEGFCRDGEGEPLWHDYEEQSGEARSTARFRDRSFSLSRRLPDAADIPEPARLAVALKAEKLIHLVESTKLLRDPAAPEAPIPELGLSQVPAMIRSGVIPPEMALKANCSVEAVRSGVRSATLLDGSVPHAILLELLSDEGIGTMLTH